MLSLTLSGGRGIRTPATLAGRPVFKTGAISRSAIPPLILRLEAHQVRPFGQRRQDLLARFICSRLR